MKKILVVALLFTSTVVTAMSDDEAEEKYSAADRTLLRLSIGGSSPSGKLNNSPRHQVDIDDIAKYVGSDSNENLQDLEMRHNDISPLPGSSPHFTFNPSQIKDANSPLISPTHGTSLACKPKKRQKIQGPICISTLQICNNTPCTSTPQSPMPTLLPTDETDDYSWAQFEQLTIRPHAPTPKQQIQHAQLIFNLLD